MKEIVIKLTDNCYKRVVDYKENLPVQILEAIRHGVVLPKGQFIAICDSDYPITENVEDTLKETVFVGGDEEHEDMYCFDIKEIIEADREGE